MPVAKAGPGSLDIHVSDYSSALISSSGLSWFIYNCMRNNVLKFSPNRAVCERKFQSFFKSRSEISNANK